MKVSPVDITGQLWILKKHLDFKMHTVELKFKIGEKVSILEIGRPGRIEAVEIHCYGIQYKVAYWDNAERRSTWLYEEELQ